MHFIFPKNYHFKSKLLGFIDYSTAILDIVIGLVLYFIIHLFIQELSTKIYVFITLFLPVLLFSILGINKESFISVFIYFFKFCKNQNIYLYQKQLESEKIKQSTIDNIFSTVLTFYKNIFLLL